MKEYVTAPSENLAERERQVSDYHPDLCFQVGQTHYAYGWSKTPRGEWNQEQADAYKRGHDAAKNNS